MPDLAPHSGKLISLEGEQSFEMGESFQPTLSALSTDLANDLPSQSMLKSDEQDLSHPQTRGYVPANFTLGSASNEQNAYT
jgi:hypothetical protein